MFGTVTLVTEQSLTYQPSSKMFVWCPISTGNSSVYSQFYSHSSFTFCIFRSEILADLINDLLCTSTALGHGLTWFFSHSSHFSVPVTSCFILLVFCFLCFVFSFVSLALFSQLRSGVLSRCLLFRPHELVYLFLPFWISCSFFWYFVWMQH